MDGEFIAASEWQEATTLALSLRKQLLLLSRADAERFERHVTSQRWASFALLAGELDKAFEEIRKGDNA